MKKNLLFALLSSSVLLSSCVSSKVYKDLEDRHAQLQEDNSELSREFDDLEARFRQNENDLAALQAQYEQTKAERDRLQEEYNSTKTSYEKLKASYDALEANSSSALAENSRRNRELLAELDAKEEALLQEKNRLEKLQKDLAARSKRVDELESMIAAKDAKMNALKNAISKALVNFEGKGLTVEQRDGKVYVSMENKLLFNSGSWAVGAEGRKAVQQLASVLAENPDIAVLIEGHTDNVPYKGSGQLTNNWDLSTKRATAIVELLLENSGINAENLTAAGRGEYAPVASNDTAEGRAKNRRIEVILTPKLDEINRLLQEPEFE
ncbi:OmpA family protein [Salinimicrobium sp. MT39]|uniref:OmpA family protein n=1 Tax=Salinimicrobium profundisediminis TaxID=2994553 RepID=A0A9X3I164_9FLAO|nr:OmpA family protein [Salinimicrobium profundisediminis]MCX2838730.1 OmpA family protein [Salinimicrobium profundisediminis]